MVVSDFAKQILLQLFFKLSIKYIYAYSAEFFFFMLHYNLQCSLFDNLSKSKEKMFTHFHHHSHSLHPHVVVVVVVVLTAVVVVVVVVRPR